MDVAAPPAEPLVPHLVVHKYGGTSVGDLERIRKVAARIHRAVDAGHKVAVTVSAMGHSTDRLVATARELTPRPDRRELDMLMATGEQVSIALLTMALQSIGVRARSLTGRQAGFLTDGVFGSARIVQVDPGPVVRALEAVDVVVIAGFQGDSCDGELTTLGRGGSDTTAVAMAAALGADECEIFTDTDGIYTTDPHVIPALRSSAPSTTTRCSSSRRSAPRCSIPGACGTRVATACGSTYALRSRSRRGRS
jgi:aspartate kinase